jgi:hypothetical protein
MSESSRSRSKRGEKITTIFPIDQTVLSETLKNIVLRIDEDGNLVALPVFLVDPTNNPMKIPGTPISHSASMAGANQATVWAPDATHRFNIIAYEIDVSASVAEAALDDAGILVQDGGSIKFIHACTIPAVSIATVAGGKTISVYIGGSGYHSSAPGNNLTINIAGNLTAGRISMTVWGYESL